MKSINKNLNEENYFDEEKSCIEHEIEYLNMKRLREKNIIPKIVLSSKEKLHFAKDIKYLYLYNVQEKDSLQNFIQLDYDKPLLFETKIIVKNLENIRIQNVEPKAICVNHTYEKDLKIYIVDFKLNSPLKYILLNNEKGTVKFLGKNRIFGKVFLIIY